MEVEDKKEINRKKEVGEGKRKKMRERETGEEERKNKAREDERTNEEPISCLL